MSEHTMSLGMNREYIMIKWLVLQEDKNPNTCTNVNKASKDIWKSHKFLEINTWKLSSTLPNNMQSKNKSQRTLKYVLLNENETSKIYGM